MCNMSATLLCLQCNGRQNGSAWTFMQEKCASIHTPRSMKRHYLEIGKKSAIFVRKGASGSITVRRQRTWRSHSHARGKPLARDITVADTYAVSYVDDTTTRAAAAAHRAVSNQPLSIHRAFHDPSLHSNCNRDRWFMEWLGHRVHQRVEEKDHSCDTRSTREAVPISENVCSIAERKCGCVSEHFSSRTLIFHNGKAIPRSPYLI